MERRPGGSGRGASGPGPTAAAASSLPSPPLGRWDHPATPPSLAGLWTGLSRGARSKILTAIGLLAALLLLEAFFANTGGRRQVGANSGLPVGPTSLGSAAIPGGVIAPPSTKAAAAAAGAASGQGLTLPFSAELRVDSQAAPAVTAATMATRSSSETRLLPEPEPKPADQVIGAASTSPVVPDGYFPIKIAPPPTLAGGRGPPSQPEAQAGRPQAQAGSH